MFSALDGARGLAVAAVVLFHGGHLIGGYLGVDFFFVLSGFLITSLLLGEAARTGGIRLGGFWARRARRLLPALGVLLVGVVLYSWLLASRSELSQIRGDAFATLGYVANWRDVWARQSYWSIFNAPSPLSHTWSLAIEEQFYVIWPLAFVALLALGKRATAKTVFVACVVLAGASAALMFVLYDPTNTNRAYYGTDTRADAILLGAALAAWFTMHGTARSRTSRFVLEAVGILGAGALMVAWMRLDGQSATLYRGGFLVCGLAATAIIAAAVHPQAGIISRVLSTRALCGLGLISYGVYLYHWPIDVMLDSKRVGYTGWPLFVTQTAVTLAIAIASYFIVEQPIRCGALSARHWRRITPALAGAVTLALLASTIGAAPSVAAGPSLPVFVAERAAATAPPGAQRVMLVGNSIAHSLGPAFERLRPSPPIALLNAAIAGCNFPPAVTAPPAVKVGSDGQQIIPRPPCHPPWETKVVNIFRPDVVFWMVSDAYHSGLTYQGRAVTPCQAPYDSIYRRSLRHEIAVLGARGATVVITTVAYQRSAGVHTDRETDCINNIRRRVAAQTGAQLVDLFTYTCPDGHCRKTQNGVTLRPDGEHYLGRGGQLVAKWLLDQTRAVH
jgi:peptidoglycan/LPS O-acetylase OafA/YrhL